MVGPQVRAGKAALRAWIEELSGKEPALPHERAHMAYIRAREIAPEASFEEQLAAVLMISIEDLQELCDHSDSAEQEKQDALNRRP